MFFDDYFFGSPMSDVFRRPSQLRWGASNSLILGEVEGGGEISFLSLNSSTNLSAMKSFGLLLILLYFLEYFEINWNLLEFFGIIGIFWIFLEFFGFFGFFWNFLDSS